MTDFSRYTERELVDNLLDRAAALTWRLDAEEELQRRGFTTRDENGNLRSRDALNGSIELFYRSIETDS